MVKSDVIWGKILAVEDQFYLKTFPCGQETSDLGF